MQTALPATPITRATGQVEDTSLPFSLPQEAYVCIRVESHDVSSARVSLDGSGVLGPSDFRPSVTLLERRQRAGVGDHSVSVHLASKPGAWLSVSVTFAPAIIADGGSVGSGPYLSASFLSAMPSQISPMTLDGLQDQARLSGSVSIMDLPGSSSGSFTYIVRSTFRVLGGEGCDEVRRIAQEEPGWSGSRSIVAWWDGLATDGTYAPNGLYGVDFDVELVRVKASNGHEDIVDSVHLGRAGLFIDNEPPALSSDDIAVVNTSLTDGMLDSLCVTTSSDVTSITIRVVGLGKDFFVVLDLATAVRTDLPDGRVRYCFTDVNIDPPDESRLAVSVTVTDCAGNSITKPVPLPPPPVPTSVCPPLSNAPLHYEPYWSGTGGCKDGLLYAVNWIWCGDRWCREAPVIMAAEGRVPYAGFYAKDGDLCADVCVTTGQADDPYDYTPLLSQGNVVYRNSALHIENAWCRWPHELRPLQGGDHTYVVGEWVVDLGHWDIPAGWMEIHSVDAAGVTRKSATNEYMTTGTVFFNHHVRVLPSPFRYRVEVYAPDAKPSPDAELVIMPGGPRVKPPAGRDSTYVLDRVCIFTCPAGEILTWPGSRNTHCSPTCPAADPRPRAVVTFDLVGTSDLVTDGANCQQEEDYTICPTTSDPFDPLFPNLESLPTVDDTLFTQAIVMWWREPGCGGGCAAQRWTSLGGTGGLLVVLAGLLLLRRRPSHTRRGP